MRSAVLVAVVGALAVCSTAQAEGLTRADTNTAIVYVYTDLAASFDGTLHVQRCHRLAPRRIRCRVRIAGPRTRCALSVGVREHGEDQWVLRTRWMRCH